MTISQTDELSYKITKFVNYEGVVSCIVEGFMMPSPVVETVEGKHKALIDIAPDGNEYCDFTEEMEKRYEEFIKSLK